MRPASHHQQAFEKCCINCEFVRFSTIGQVYLCKRGTGDVDGSELSKMRRRSVSEFDQFLADNTVNETDVCDEFEDDASNTIPPSSSAPHRPQRP